LMSLLAQLGPSAMSALSPLSGEEGHEMLGSSLSAFDPSRTSAANFAVMH